MSISNNYVPLKQIGNGVTTEFSGTWPVLSASFLQVFLENVATGVQVAVDEGGASDEYTLTFDENGFIVTFNTAPTSSNYVVVGRNVSLDQNTPYKTSKGFQGEVTEDSFDKITAITQDLKEELSRTPKSALGGDPLSFDSYLSGRVLGWSSTETGKVVSSSNTIADMEGAINAVAALAAGSGVKVSSNDTTTGFLNGKLIAGQSLEFVENNNGSDETLTVNVEEASETQKGVVEKATDAELKAGTAGKYPDAAQVKSLSDEVIIGRAYFRYELADGGDHPAVANGWDDVPLNTELENTIADLTFDPVTGYVSLPAGKYRFQAKVSSYYNMKTQAAIYDITNTAPLFLGENYLAGYRSGSSSANAACLSYSPLDSSLITLAADTSIKLECFRQLAYSVGGGTAVNSGRGEVYSSLKIQKIL